jgi:hypothetical protein
VSVLVWAYAFFMSIVVYDLPPAGHYPYPIKIFGAAMMSLLGWYNAERGSTHFEVWIGTFGLYLIIGAGILMIIGLR